jgi:histidine triad (HIT) family protein
MFNHAPSDYACPFCRIVQTALSNHPLADSAADVICQTEAATAFLALSRWPKNPCDVLIVPNTHCENLFDLPDDLVPALHATTRRVALALKEIYRCNGISTRQHNEPAGDQDVWHYHVHVTPRFHRDDFYRSHKIPFPEAERLEEARRLREYLIHAD